MRLRTIAAKTYEVAPCPHPRCTVTLEESGLETGVIIEVSDKSIGNDNGSSTTIVTQKNNGLNAIA
jgi:hypothetical protein